MFKQQTVLDITDLPTEVRGWVHKAYQDQISGNGCYFTVCPYEVFEWDEEAEQRSNRILPFDEFRTHLYDCEDTYNFMRWCVEHGQTEDFILLYWW